MALNWLHFRRMTIGTSVRPYATGGRMSGQVDSSLLADVAGDAHFGISYLLEDDSREHSDCDSGGCTHEPADQEDQSEREMVDAMVR